VRGVGLWIVGAILIALIGTVPVVHQHHAATTPGWYDEECPLDRLATGRPGLAPDDPASALARLLAGDRVALPTAPPSGPGAPRRATARAPPLAS
jgi:hypothetical protein